MQTIACEREAPWATPVVAELGRVHHLKLHRRLELAELTLESAHNLRIGWVAAQVWAGRGAGVGTVAAQMSAQLRRGCGQVPAQMWAIRKGSVQRSRLDRM